MKSLREYLTENKKVYNFKIKIAGDVPEKFEENLKKKLARVDVITFEKMKTTPVQKAPLDFPLISNAEVTIFNVVLEYPITAPEIVNDIKELGLSEEYFLVRGSDEPVEYDHLIPKDHKGEAILDDPDYKTDETAIEQENLAGPEFNKTFLADLAKAAADRKKELDNPTDPNVLSSHSKEKADKAGQKSAIGSK